MGPQVSLATFLRTAPPPPPSPGPFDPSETGTFQSYLDSVRTAPAPGNPEPQPVVSPRSEPRGPQAITDDSPPPPAPTGSKPRLTRSGQQRNQTPEAKPAKVEIKPAVETAATQDAKDLPDGAVPFDPTGVPLPVPAFLNPMGQKPFPVIDTPPAPDANATPTAPVITPITANIVPGAAPPVPLPKIQRAPILDSTANVAAEAEVQPVLKSNVSQTEVPRAQNQSSETPDEPAVPKRAFETPNRTERVPEQNRPQQPIQFRAPNANAHLESNDGRIAARSAPNGAAAKPEVSENSLAQPESTASSKGLLKSAEATDSEPAPLKPNQSTQSPIPPANTNRRSDAQAVETKSISVRTGEGDSAAANVGRFLVQSDASTVSTGAASPSSAAPATHNMIAPSAPSAAAPHVRTPAGPAPAAAPTTTLADILSPPTDGMNRIEQAVSVLAASRTDGADRHQATLQLDPPELGQLRIDIRLHDQGMVMRVDAQNAATAKLIESRLPELRDALAIHGIRVDQSEVVVRSPESGNAGDHSNAHRSDTGSQGQQPSWFAGGQGSGSPQEREGWAAQSQPGIMSPEAAAASIPFAPSIDISEGYVNLVA